ncbi:MAG: hypothetical protein HFF00_04840 [Ruminiclostridium sp.]|jgi:hypothetical protein|nr:hypothetical protein [Ruminiclostridium sp.]
MKMALKGNTLILVEVDNVQFAIIKSWNKMKWDKKSQTLHGFADIELLDKLASIVRLPSTVEQRRRKLYAIQEAVDRERVNPDPVPLYKYPVKMPLYNHQARGANMAILTFGWITPKGGEAHG